MGEGEPLVRPSHWLTHLEHDLTNPVWRHVQLGLAHGRQLVRFDARGNGLSQRDPREEIAAGSLARSSCRWTARATRRWCRSRPTAG
ncbi:MAG TPA: hypothetical protein VF559_07735 [Caulobacteraceae bacterium]|jgi:hypothetical protein